MVSWRLRKYFHNHVKIISTKSRIFLAQCQEMFKKQIFFKGLVFLNMILWTCRIRFWRPHREIFARRPKIFHSGSENEKHCYFFQTFPPPPKMFLRQRFWNPPLKEIVEKPKRFFTQCPKIWIKKYNCFKNFKFPQMFLRIRGMQFWQLCRKILWNQDRKLLANCPKTTKCNFLAIKWFFQSAPPGHVERSFENLVEIFSSKIRKFLLSARSWSDNINFFKRKFSRECSFGQVICSFDNPAEKFLTKGQNFSLHVRKRQKIYVNFCK